MHVQEERIKNGVLGVKATQLLDVPGVIEDFASFVG